MMKKTGQQQSQSKQLWEEDWFSNVEQEIERNRSPIQRPSNVNDLDETTIFTQSKPKPRQRAPKQHGAMFNKTQQFLSARGVGWLMETEEVASTPQKKENLLGGETAEQTEPSILEELDIDLADIAWRVKQVLIPFRQYDPDTQRKLLLQDEGDFWGPFFIVLAYALLNVSFSQLKVITWVFLIWLVGSWLLWFLTRLIAPAEQDSNNNNNNTSNTIDNNDQLPSELPLADTTTDTTTATTTATNNTSGSNNNNNSLYFGQVVSFVGYGLIPHVFSQLLLVLWSISSPYGAIGSFTKCIDIGLGCLALVWSTYSCGKLMCTCMKSLEEKKKLVWWPILLVYLYFLVMH